MRRFVLYVTAQLLGACAGAAMLRVCLPPGFLGKYLDVCVRASVRVHARVCWCITVCACMQVCRGVFVSLMCTCAHA